MRNLLLSAALIALAACSPAATTSSATSTASTATIAAEPAHDATSTVQPSAAYIVAALADRHRSDEERARDAGRHPGDTLALAEVAPGQKIAELVPGSGYFTRLFADVVGVHGKVYAINRTHPSQYEGPVLANVANVQNVSQDLDKFTLPEPVDLVFTAQNYHDLKITSFHMGDTVGMDRQAFAALKPGGIYIVIDHSARAGTVEDQGHTLHRIDQDLVRREVESVGFVYDGESQMLRNPADPRTANVFDASIRGHTDQFFMRFRKPTN